MIPERRRLAVALLLSLLVHALGLSLTFGAEGDALPGLALPWRERRVEVPDLRVVLVDAPAAAASPSPGPTAAPLVDAATDARTDVAAAGAPSSATATPMEPAPPADTPDAPPQPQAEPAATRDVAATAADAKEVPAAPSPLPQAQTNADIAPGTPPEPPLMALDDIEASVIVVPPLPAVPQPVAPPAPSASAPQTVLSAAAHARAVTLRQSTLARPEPALELTMLERALRQLQQEERQLNAALDDGTMLQARRQEAAQQEAARQEAARQEAARQEAARQEAVRQEAARQEAARQEAARQEAARAKAADDERREAARRAMGRQLDEEAARREAAASSQRSGARPEPSASTRRRGRLFGHTDADAELILYAEAWARKIQLNRTFDLVREAARQPHADPLVTVAIRSDGFVESVTFVISSGVAEIDDAIRRIVHSQEPYQAFSPALAREYDVVEIRRTWYFDMAVRLH